MLAQPPLARTALLSINLLAQSLLALTVSASIGLLVQSSTARTALISTSLLAQLPLARTALVSIRLLAQLLTRTTLVSFRLLTQSPRARTALISVNDSIQRMSINQFIIIGQQINIVQVDLSALHCCNNGTDDEAEPHCSQIWGFRESLPQHPHRRTSFHVGGGAAVSEVHF